MEIRKIANRFTYKILVIKTLKRIKIRLSNKIFDNFLFESINKILNKLTSI